MEPNLGFQDEASLPPELVSTTFLKIVVLPQVSKLWLGVSNGMLPVRDLVPKVLMAVSYCGHQLTQMLGWAAIAYYRRKVQPRIMELAGIACSMMGDVMGTLGCELGHGM